MRSLSASALCSITVALMLMSATPSRGQGAAQPGGPAAPQARGGRPGGPPPSPATLKRARKVLLDAIVKEVATRKLGDCTTKDALGAKIVSVERFNAATGIWPVHATAVCTGPNSIVEVPAMTFDMTRSAKGEWKATYVKDDAAN
jgi:hypothetical protein